MQKLLGHKYLLWAAVLYTMVVIWLSTAKLIFPVQVPIEGSDKIGHFLAYAGFTMVWFLFCFYSEKIKYSFTKSMLSVSVYSFLFGITMEGCQALFTNYRSPDWKDVIANTTGIIFAAIILKLFENKLIAYKKAE